MKKMNKITVIGSGTSTGVPILGCKCSVCQSNDIRNKRFRTSAVIELTNGSRILIDSSPDLRTQLICNKIDRIDSVIITHDHADHTHGIDDLRPFGFHKGSGLTVFTNPETAASLTKKFPYIFDRQVYFKDRRILGGGIPLLELKEIYEGPWSIEDETFEFYSLPHGHENTLGIRHGKMAYLIDCREIPPSTLEKLSNARLDLLIIDCLRPLPHQTHLHLERTLEYIEKIKPCLSVLTHMGHEWDYRKLSEELIRHGVKNTIPAIDGQSFLYS